MGPLREISLAPEVRDDEESLIRARVADPASRRTRARRFDGISLVTHPSVATQPLLIAQESPRFEPLPLAG